MKPSMLFHQSELGGALWDVLKPYNGWRENLLYGMFSNIYCSDPTPKELFESKGQLSNPFALGYILFGPMVFNFLSWLINASTRDGVRKLKFLSREGFLLNQAFETMVTHPSLKKTDIGKIKGTYFLCSRRAMIMAALRTESDIPLMLKTYFQGTVRAFFDKRMIVSDLDIIEKRLGTTVFDQDISLPRDYEYLQNIISKVFDIIVKRSEIERMALLKYCEEQGVNTSEKIGLVDVGYSGSIQIALSDLLGRPFMGYYFVHEKAESKSSIPGSIFRGYFGEFDKTDPKKNNLPIYRYSLLLESVLTAPIGQLISFQIGPMGTTPIYKEPGVSQKNFPLIHLIQEGTLQFIKDMLDLFGAQALDVEFPNDLIQRCYEMISIGDIRCGDLEPGLSVEDDFCGNGEIPVLKFYLGKK
jgi:hypothetical protein